MDCRKAKILIPLYYDEDCSPEDNKALAAHLNSCRECSRELALYNKISQALKRLGEDEVQAPAALCGKIMGQLQKERRSLVRLLPAAWRRAMAAAAAILLVTGASAGVLAGGGKMIGLVTSREKAPDPDYINTAPLIPSPDRANTGGDLPGLPAQTPAGEGTAPAQDGNNGENKTGDNNTKEGAQQGYSSKDTAVPIHPATPTNGPIALTSNALKVRSTNLTLEVADLAEARARGVALAAGAGASLQVFPEQSDGQKVLIMRMAVDADSSSQLIAGLMKNGTLVGRHDEVQDNTSFYNETLVKYTDLQARLSTTTDASERQQLELQAASYKQALDAKLAEAGKHIIILQLEEK